jgi:hypothetical protein
MIAPKTPSPLYAIFIYITIFAASLLAAYVLYGVLGSTGAFESKGIQLGGAAAGFAAVLWLSDKIFHNLLSTIHAHQKESSQTEQLATIARQNAIITELVAAQLSPRSIPRQFVAAISKDAGIAYAYPMDWVPSDERFVGIYFRPVQATENDPEVFRGNITVTSKRLDIQIPDDAGGQPVADATMDLTLEQVKTLYRASEITSERIMVDGIPGRRHRGKYTHFQSGVVVGFDIILALDIPSARIFTFALHEREALLESSSSILLTIVGTIKIKA